MFMVDQRDVLVIMGSTSDWPTMKCACVLLVEFGISHKARVVSAHRTPQRLVEVVRAAPQAGFKVIIAGAGGAAHLPGMAAALCPALPVLGVPVQSKALNGHDSLLSIVQMPAGVPVGCLAIGEAGAKNAAHLAAQIIGLINPDVQARYVAYREKMTNDVPEFPV
jgi:5-(carboxyamino)imidazole ribonucleotide mutase